MASKVKGRPQLDRKRGEMGCCLLEAGVLAGGGGLRPIEVGGSESSSASAPPVSQQTSSQRDAVQPTPSAGKIQRIKCCCKCWTEKNRSAF